MSKRLNDSRNTRNTNKRMTRTRSNVGIVIAVILDEDSEKLYKSDNTIFSTGKNTYAVGSCVIRSIDNSVTSDGSLSIYPPYDSSSIDMPLVGETVELIKVGNSKFYKRINRSDLNVGNAIENINQQSYPETRDGGEKSKSYSKVEKTGISNNQGSNDRDSSVGNYFEYQQANRLRLYEGDKLIQSRFGQSIRFSGYNNAENKFSPVILIRNRQSAVSINELESGDITEEDVNRDGSTIALTSANYKSTFQPGTVDDGGSSDFETKPIHFKDYPSELTGQDQILINSERILISSRSSEMIFYSKGNWGFISDGTMSIDNGKSGANLDFNGDVRLTTNDFHTYILGGKGRIFLNTEESKEPLLRGQTTVDLLKELIDAINAQVFATPSGPTLTGPNNRSDFSKIKSKLDTMLSTLNFTE